MEEKKTFKEKVGKFYKDHELELGVSLIIVGSTMMAYSVGRIEGFFKGVRFMSDAFDLVPK